MLLQGESTATTKPRNTIAASLQFQNKKKKQKKNKGGEQKLWKANTWNFVKNSQKRISFGGGRPGVDFMMGEVGLALFFCFFFPLNFRGNHDEWPRFLGLGLCDRFRVPASGAMRQSHPPRRRRGEWKVFYLVGASGLIFSMEGSAKSFKDSHPFHL